MKTVVATLLVYALAMLGLALGHLLRRPGRRGTCARGCDVCPRKERP
jgi:hypothetical protein